MYFIYIKKNMLLGKIKIILMFEIFTFRENIFQIRKKSKKKV